MKKLTYASLLSLTALPMLMSSHDYRGYADADYADQSWRDGADG